MYRELLATSVILNIFDSLLTAVTVFSLSYIIIYFYRISYYFAVLIAVLFFIRSFSQKLKQNKILIIEKKYPDLKERLRTSYDYQENSNTVIDSLHKDITRMMKKVDVNAFLEIKKLASKIMVIIVMLLAVLYFSSVGFDILDIKTRIVNSAFYNKLDTFSKDLFDTRDEITDRPKLDDPRLLILGDKDLNVSIDTYNTELDITDISEAEKNDYGGHYPEEVKGAAQEIYEDKIPEEHKEVIKDYFKKINE